MADGRIVSLFLGSLRHKCIIGNWPPGSAHFSPLDVYISLVFFTGFVWALLNWLEVQMAFVAGWHVAVVSIYKAT
jgi:hypothetical protein